MWSTKYDYLEVILKKSDKYNGSKIIEILGDNGWDATNINGELYSKHLEDNSLLQYLIPSQALIVANYFLQGNKVKNGLNSIQRKDLLKRLNQLTPLTSLSIKDNKLVHSYEQRIFELQDLKNDLLVLIQPY